MRDRLDVRPERDSLVVKAFKAASKGRCEVCRWKPPMGLELVRHAAMVDMLHAHHVVPIACGGADSAANLILLCPTHHAVAHALGQMIMMPDQTRRVWRGPTSREQLLFEIRLMEKEPGPWRDYVSKGRPFGRWERPVFDPHAALTVEERRATMQVLRPNSAEHSAGPLVPSGGNAANPSTANSRGGT